MRKYLKVVLILLLVKTLIGLIVSSHYLLGRINQLEDRLNELIIQVDRNE